MDDREKAALAAAAVGGYVMGRTKKGRLALSVATYLAGRRFGLEPRQLAAEGLRRLGEIPQVAELQEQLRREVLNAGQEAMSAAARRGMSTLADALSERTALVGRKTDEGEKAEDEEGEEESAAAEKDAGEGEEPEARRRHGGSRSGGPRKETASAAPRKAAATREEKQKAAVKTRPRKTAPAKKTTPTKRTAANKTASSKRAASKRTDRRR